MKQPQLTETESYIWNYIHQHFHAISEMTISELSEAANVSNASIIRTLKKQGYNGFSEFKHDIASKNRDSLQILNHPHLSDDTRQSIIKNYQEVIRTLNMMDVEVIEQVLPRLQKAERLVIFARGFSELIASEMLIKFQLTGKYCELHTDPNIIRPVSKRLTADDFVLFISLNGQTRALVDAAKNCREQAVPSLLISSIQTSPLSQLSDFQLIGFKTDLSFFPDFEVHSRLPLAILSRILLDAYAASLKL